MKHSRARLVVMHSIIVIGISSLIVLALHGNISFTVASVAAATSGHTIQVPQFDPTSPIALEHQLPGTTQWMIPLGTNTTFIQGYIGSATVLPGVVVPIYVSSQKPSGFQLDIFRMGWYGGLGGRLYLHVSKLTSLAQGIWDEANGWVEPCATCSIDPQTHLLEAHWKSTYSFPVGPWLSGVYLIKLTAANGAASYIPFIVRVLHERIGPQGHTSAPVLADIPFNTSSAYNVWGGYSLYGAYIDHMLDYAQRAYKVSCDRPYVQGAGAGDFLSWDIHSVRWMERADLNVTYTADPALMLPNQSITNYHVIIMLGHSEYWSTAMRDGLEQARNAGVSLFFLGADNSYWKVRYEADAENDPARTVVCYKVSSGDPDGTGNTLALDPDYPTVPDQVTTLWRDPYSHRPENSLLGLQYHDIIAGPPVARPDWVATEKPDPMLQGTGLHPGEHISGGLLGYEFDGYGLLATQPPHLHLLGISPLLNFYHQSDVAFSAYYYAPSGALVFDAGSIWWAWALDESSPPQAPQQNTLLGSQPINLLTFQILKAMLSISSQSAKRT